MIVTCVAIGLDVLVIVCASMSIWHAHRATKLARIALQANIDRIEWIKAHGLD